MKQAVVALLALSGSACGDDNQTNLPDAPPAGITIAPPTADVLTCSTQQYTTTDTATPAGTWSATPGSISATGLYTSPLTAAAPSAQVSYMPGTGPALHATANLATAFPGAPVNIDLNFMNESTPYEHVLASNGMRVYAVFPVDPAGGVRILRSDNGGATFTAKPTLSTPSIKCATSAVDVANPDILYVATHTTADAESSLTLFVSEDGGATFAHSYRIADSILDGLPLQICPDVVVPSANAVIVASASQNGDQTKSWTSLWASTDRGASFGSGNGTNSSDYFSSADTNLTNVFTGGTVLSDGGQYGPRAFSDGKGHACTSYSVDGGSGCTSGSCNDVMVQCSVNSGATWSAPHKLGGTSTATYPTGSVSPSGNIAVTWSAKDANGDVQLQVAISKDHGATWLPNVTYPFDKATFGYTASPVVMWDGDVLWLQQTTAESDNPVVVIDKTCDFGASWSGPVPITMGSDYVGNALILTAKGMVSVNRGLRDTANRPLSLITLAPL